MVSDPYNPDCFRCDTIKLEKKDIVRLRRGTSKTSCSYSFICPECNIKQSKDITWDAFEQLEKNKVCKVFEPSGFGESDIDDFIKELDSDEMVLEKFKNTATKSGKTKKKNMEEISFSFSLRTSMWFASITGIASIVIAHFFL